MASSGRRLTETSALLASLWLLCFLATSLALVERRLDARGKGFRRPALQEVRHGAHSQVDSVAGNAERRRVPLSRHNALGTPGARLPGRHARNVRHFGKSQEERKMGKSPRLDGDAADPQTLAHVPQKAAQPGLRYRLAKNVHRLVPGGLQHKATWPIVDSVQGRHGKTPHTLIEQQNTLLAREKVNEARKLMQQQLERARQARIRSRDRKHSARQGHGNSHADENIQAPRTARQQLPFRRKSITMLDGAVDGTQKEDSARRNEKAKSVAGGRVEGNGNIMELQASDAGTTVTSEATRESVTAMPRAKQNPAGDIKDPSQDTGAEDMPGIAPHDREKADREMAAKLRNQVIQDDPTEASRTEGIVGFDSEHRTVHHVIHEAKPVKKKDEEISPRHRQADYDHDEFDLAPYGKGSQLPYKHPMVLFNADEVKELKRQSQNSHSKIFNHLRQAASTMLDDEEHYMPPEGEQQFASSWNEHYGNNLVVLAFFSALQPENSVEREVAIKSLRRLASYRSWQVKASPGDDVPRAHTLFGVAMAFDILFHHLHEAEQHSIPKRIQEETSFLHHRALSRAGWNRQYVHNHMLTIQTALLVGALVTEGHSMAPALQQQALARLHMERVLELLRRVTDGSIDEGVAYTTYSTRSLFLYIHLAQRHYGTQHFDHPWLGRHFSLLLSSTLPGYGGSIGIGDSNPTWYFGPEAQLCFLDKFVLRDGTGNWLAAELRNARLRQASTHGLLPVDWPMLPFEYLWYAPHLQPAAPSSADISGLKVLEDWGVVTYKSGTKSDATFFSLKSGYTLGRGLHEVASDSAAAAADGTHFYLKGFSSFNAGHEHPDQGSFTFYPLGKPFVTESFYYKPKLPHMENTWLFKPQNSPDLTSSSCSGGELVGQLGACENWFRWQPDEVQKMSADIIMAESESGMSLVVSESAGAYSTAMGIQSLTRTALVLNKHALLIVDSVHKSPYSPVLRGSVFFNNMYEKFNVDFEETKMATCPDSGHTIQWVTDLDQATQASVGTTPSKKLRHKRGNRDEGHYLNVSVPLLMDTTHVAWLLTTGSAPAEVVIERSSQTGIVLTVSLGKLPPYTVSMVTNHTCTLCRYFWHGSGVLAHVQHANSVVRFGAARQDTSVNIDLDLRPMKRVLPSAIHQQMFIYLCITVIGWSLMAVILFWKFPFLRKPQFLWPIAGCVLVWLVVVIFLTFTTLVAQLPNTMKLGLLAQPSSEGDIMNSGMHTAMEMRPRVLITGLPSGNLGITLAEHIFRHATDVVFIPFSDLPISEGSVSSPLSACVWDGDGNSYFHSLAVNWMQQVYDHAPSLVRHAFESHANKNGTHSRHFVCAGNKLLRDPMAVVAGGDMDGSWLLKVNWFQTAIHSSKVLVFVQDPRHWVGGVLQRGTLLPGSDSTLKEQIAAVLGNLDAHCDHTSSCARVLDSLRQLALSENSRATPALHKVLASLWLAYTDTVLCLAKDNANIHLIKVENFNVDAVEAAREIYRSIELPYRPAVMHHLRTITQSGLPEFAGVSEEIAYGSRVSLDSMAIVDIVAICNEAMDQLGYYTTRKV